MLRLLKMSCLWGVVLRSDVELLFSFFAYGMFFFVFPMFVPDCFMFHLSFSLLLLSLVILYVEVLCTRLGFRLSTIYVAVVLELLYDCLSCHCFSVVKSCT